MQPTILCTAVQKGGVLIAVTPVQRVLMAVYMTCTYYDRSISPMAASSSSVGWPAGSCAWHRHQS
jgi:hypothetical protein